MSAWWFPPNYIYFMFFQLQAVANVLPVSGHSRGYLDNHTHGDWLVCKGGETNSSYTTHAYVKLFLWKLRSYYIIQHSIILVSQMAFADAVEPWGCISWSLGTLVGLHALHHLPLTKGAWPSVTKPIMVGKAPCKLLRAFKVLANIKASSWWLIYRLLDLSWYQSL